MATGFTKGEGAQSIHNGRGEQEMGEGIDCTNGDGIDLDEASIFIHRAERNFSACTSISLKVFFWFRDCGVDLRPSDRLKLTRIKP
jgi:hypothetical protein